MSQLMLDYDSSLWQRIGADLIAQSPVLLAYIAALIVACIYVGRRTMPAALLAAASGIYLVWSVLSRILFHLAWERVYTGEAIPEDNQAWMIGLEIGWIVVRIASLALFVFAALGWRSGDGQVGQDESAYARGQSVHAAAGVSVTADPSLRPIAKPLYILFIFGMTLLCVGLLVPAYAILFTKNEELIFVSIGLSCMAYIGLLVSAVMGYVLLYKLWNTIQDGPARTTPGKAIGFLFIPFFNLYWVFQAVWGWAVDFNNYTAEKGIAARRVPEGLALTLCIIGVIPYINILVSPVCFVLAWIYWSRAIDGANTVRRLKSAA